MRYSHYTKLLMEAANNTKQLKHLSHLEDLVFEEGHDAIPHVVSSLEIAKNIYRALTGKLPIEELEDPDEIVREALRLTKTKEFSAAIMKLIDAGKKAGLTIDIEPPKNKMMTYNDFVKNMEESFLFDNLLNQILEEMEEKEEEDTEDDEEYDQDIPDLELSDEEVDDLVDELMDDLVDMDLEDDEDEEDEEEDEEDGEDISESLILEKAKKRKVKKSSPKGRSLSVRGRGALRRSMRKLARTAAFVAKRSRAMYKLPTRKVLMRRARKAAVAAMRRKFARNAPLTSQQQKARVEKMLTTPQSMKRISNMAKRTMTKVMKTFQDRIAARRARR